MHTILGLDIGHSAVKLASLTQTSFPAAASRAKGHSIGLGAGADADDEVMLDGVAYHVGNSALTHAAGRIADGLTDDWIASPEYKALMLAGFQKVSRREGGDAGMVAMGLPSRLYDSQKNAIRDMACELLDLEEGNALVLPQPLAALYSTLLNRRGFPVSEEIMEGSWYVVDVGFYTTDFGYMERGVWSAAGQESTFGAHVAAQELRKLAASSLGIEVSIREASRVLETRKIKNAGEVIEAESLVTEAENTIGQSIADSLLQLFGAPAIRNADGIVVVGGGASIAQGALGQQWKHAKATNNPRFAVAEGLRRFGQGVALARGEKTNGK